MANVHLELTVTPSDRVSAYFLRVNNVVIRLNSNRSGAIDLSTNSEHILQWYFIGNPGDSIGIEGKVDQTDLVTVKKSQIPSGSISQGGTKRFAT